MLLRRMGVNRPPIEVTADPAFVLQAEKRADMEEWFQTVGVPIDRPLLGVALRPWKGNAPSAIDYAQMVVQIVQKTGVHPVFVPMQCPSDLLLAEQVAKSVSCELTLLHELLAPRMALGVIGAMSGLVAMRLHALIFGAMGGVPLVALGYDPKVASLMDDLGQGERCVSLENFAPSRVAEQMVEALSEGGVLRERLLMRAAELARRARENVERAMAVAERAYRRS
jgi:polysaccharide pyruvyl transferase WcaK-like protein